MTTFSLIFDPLEIWVTHYFFRERELLKTSWNQGFVLIVWSFVCQHMRIRWKWWRDTNVKEQHLIEHIYLGILNYSLANDCNPCWTLQKGFKSMSSLQCATFDLPNLRYVREEWSQDKIEKLKLSTKRTRSVTIHASRFLDDFFFFLTSVHRCTSLVDIEDLPQALGWSKHVFMTSQVSPWFGPCYELFSSGFEIWLFSPVLLLLPLLRSQTHRR